jgi:thioredoxin 2
MLDSVVRPCEACAAKNRVPVRHLADRGRCGSCQATLPPLADPLDVDGDGFADIVASARVPVLVDFWAQWCPPCRMAAPAVKKVAGEMLGRAIVLKVNTDLHPELAARYEVRGIPHFVVLKGGRVVSQQAGLVSAREMRNWLERAETV